jgi:hypothetical protein
MDDGSGNDHGFVHRESLASEVGAGIERLGRGVDLE